MNTCFTISDEKLNRRIYTAKESSSAKMIEDEIHHACEKHQQTNRKYQGLDLKKVVGFGSYQNIDKNRKDYLNSVIDINGEMKIVPAERRSENFIEKVPTNNLYNAASISNTKCTNVLTSNKVVQPMEPQKTTFANFSETQHNNKQSHHLQSSTIDISESGDDTSSNGSEYEDDFDDTTTSTFSNSPNLSKGQRNIPKQVTLLTYIFEFD